MRHRVNIQIPNEFDRPGFGAEASAYTVRPNGSQMIANEDQRRQVSFPRRDLPFLKQFL